jgi:hypothetical protein
MQGWALAVRHSGHRVLSIKEDPGFESPPGCKVFRSLNIALLLLKLKMHCHCAYLRKINTYYIYVVKNEKVKCSALLTCRQSSRGRWSCQRASAWGPRDDKESICGRSVERVRSSLLKFCLQEKTQYGSYDSKYKLFKFWVLRQKNHFLCKQAFNLTYHQTMLR